MALSVIPSPYKNFCFYPTPISRCSWKDSLRTPTPPSHFKHLSLLLPHCWFHGPSIISAASNVVFWTFFLTKPCCVVCHAYCFWYGPTNMAQEKCPKKHIPFDFWNDSTLANQGTLKTIEKSLKELPWNQQPTPSTTFASHKSLDRTHVNPLLDGLCWNHYQCQKATALNQKWHWGGGGGVHPPGVFPYRSLFPVVFINIASTMLPC